MKHISNFLDLVELDTLPLKLAAKINLTLGNDDEAIKICKKLKKIESITLRDIEEDSEILELPHYYDY